MAVINGLGERTIMDLQIPGLSEELHDNEIEMVYYPNQEKPFWEIHLKSGIVINATGNVTLRFES